MLPYKLIGIAKEAPLVLVGLGNMGKAMLRGWLKNGVEGDSIRVVTPRIEVARDEFPEIPTTNILPHPDEMDDNAGAIVLAVKPQKMDEVAPGYIKFARKSPEKKPVYLSIAAGKKLGYFEDIYGRDVPIVRCMPNTPCAIGYGISGMISNAIAESHHQELCTSLMSGMGQVLWLDKEQEDLMNVITGISGSGPAFFFHYVECIYQAGVKNGLHPEAALLMANSTVIGSAMLLAKMIKDNGGKDNVHNLLATQLRQQVTSPNGTTYAGLTRLMDQDRGLQTVLDETIERAIERSRELGNPPQDKPPADDPRD